MTELPGMTNERRYMFVSDVHLGGFSPEKNREIEQDFMAMIDYAVTHHMQIIILGDLFDYWMEYPGHAPDISPSLLNRFENLHKTTPGTLYITGNHDNWTLSRFTDLGFDLESECRTLQINNRNVFLLHGDGLSRRQYNLPRPFLHRVLRNSYFISLYQKILPPRSGIALMRMYSRSNRQIKSTLFEPGNPKLDSWAIHHIKSGKADVVICGHHHKPIFETFDDNKLYMNLGNFFDNRQAGIFSNKGFHLGTWDGVSKTFTIKNTLTLH